MAGNSRKSFLGHHCKAFLLGFARLFRSAESFEICANHGDEMVYSGQVSREDRSDNFEVFFAQGIN